MFFHLRFSLLILVVSSVFAYSNDSHKDNGLMQRLYNKVTTLFKKPADRVVEGDLFIIPNGIYKGSEFDTDESQENAGLMRRLVSKITPGFLKKPDSYELKIGKREPSVQVWATSKDYKDTLIIHLSKEEREDKEGSCNWRNHGHPRLEQFPYVLPLNLFVDNKGELKKEGDTVTIFHNNQKTRERVKVLLTLRQGNYRYKYCGGGEFDGCIRAMSRDYKRVAEPYLKSFKEKSSPLYAYDNQYRLFMGL